MNTENPVTVRTYLNGEEVCSFTLLRMPADGRTCEIPFALPLNVGDRLSFTYEDPLTGMFPYDEYAFRMSCGATDVRFVFPHFVGGATNAA